MIQTSKNFTIIGDPHARKRKGGSLDYQGIEPLDVTISSLESALLSSGMEKPIRPVYIAGDLLDKAQFNHAELKELIFIFNQYRDVPVYLIRGNHDTPLVHKWGVNYPTNHALYVLSLACENVEVVHTDAEEYYHHIYETDTDIFLLFFLPYMESDTSFKEALKAIVFMAEEVADMEKKKTVKPLLICHQSIDPLVPNVSVTLDDFKGFYWVWNGHIHTRSLLGNPAVETEPTVRILGSLTYQSRSDDISGSPDKGYYIIDLEAEGKPLEEHYITVECPKIVEAFVGEPAVEGAYMFWKSKDQSPEIEEAVVGQIVDDHSKDGRVSLAMDFLAGLSLENPQVAPLLRYLIEKEVTGTAPEGIVDNTFLRLRIEGFLSYAGQVEYDLSYEGKTYIHGLEGSGKSNILKALVWVLTGTYWNKQKKFTKPSSYPTYSGQVEGFKGCRVELDIERNGEAYTIARTSGRYSGDVHGENLPEGLLLVHEGSPVNFDELLTGDAYDQIPQAARRNNQKLLDFLGLSVNDVLYTIAIRPEFSDLISAKQDEARKIFDAMVGADWIGKIRKTADNSYLRSVNQRVQAEDKVGLLQTAVEGVELDIEAAKASHTQRVAQYEEKIAEASQKLTTAKANQKAKNEAVVQANQTVNQIREAAPEYDSNKVVGISGEVSTLGAELSGINYLVENFEEAKRKLGEAENELLGIDRTQKLQEKELQTQTEKVGQLKTRIKEALEHIQTLRDLTTIGQDIDEYEGVRNDSISRIGTLEGLIQVHSQAIAEAEEELRVLSEEGANCPECGQPLPKAKLEELIGQKKEALTTKKANQQKREKELERKQKEKTDAVNTLSELEAEETERDEADSGVEELRTELRTASTQVEKIETYLGSVGGLKKTAQSRVESLNTTIDQFDEGKTSKLKAEKEARVQELNEQLAGLEEAKNKRAEYLETVLEPVATIAKQREEELQTANESLAAAKASLGTLKENKPGKDPDNLKSLLERLKTAQDEKKKADEILADEQQKEEAYTLIKSKVLNPKGLKPFVIGKKLSAINYYCLQYSKIVENVLQVRVDQKGNYIFDVLFNGEIRDGVSLSTGWTFHANMTLLGALIKERERRTKVNLLFIDEPFATIPEESVYKVSTMIDAVGEGKAVHIITHSQSLDVTLARSVRIAGGIEEGKEVPSRIEI